MRVFVCVCVRVCERVIVSMCDNKSTYSRLRVDVGAANNMSPQQWLVSCVSGLLAQQHKTRHL